MLPVIITLSVVALAGIAGLLVAIITLSRTNLKFGNQLSANSDLQVRRIEVESGAESVGRYAAALKGTMNGASAPGYVPPTEEDGEVQVPFRGQMG